MADPYTTLGVSKTASQDEIRKAYRRLAKETHPDLNPGNAEAEKRFKDVASAYDIVGDEGKRKKFDAGDIDEHGADKPERRYYREYAEADPGMRYNRGASAGPSSGFQADDIFADLFRNRRGGGGRGGAGFRAEGADVHYVMEVSFLEAAKGGRRKVSMPDGKTLDIEIPAGLRDGQVLRLKGQGQPGIGGAGAGDAYVAVEIPPHPDFRREGYDIHSILPVSLGEALNGASIRTQTIDGPVNVKVPRRAKDATVLRLKGKGLIKDKAGARGDQKIELRIVPPENGDDELADFMAAWEAKHPQHPRDKTGDV
jgi:DnaJ-class molecular chaperone